MNIHPLEYIIAISEEKSLSRAADRLLVSQPALTQQVKKIEKELDAKLFYRDKNQLLMTDAGKIYVNGARSVLNIYNRALSEIRDLRLSSRRKITLICGISILPDLSSKVLPAFAESHGDILLDLMRGDVSVSKDYLTGGMADLAIFAADELSHSILEYIPLRDDELVLALPSGHPLAASFRENGVDLSLLSGELFILSQEGSFFRTLELKVLTEARVLPNVLCEISDFTAAQHMVASGKAAAFLPRSLAQENDGCAYFPLTPPAAFHIVIAYHKTTVLTGALRDLVMLLLNIYGER